MTNYAKLIDGIRRYAPGSTNKTLGYNLESNRAQMLADGYKPVVMLPNKDKFTDCEGFYSFHFIETETAIEERAAYHPYGYEELRRKAYPGIEMLCDALVKINSGDSSLKAAGEEQLAAYVQNCLQVKAKYPKPN